MSVTTCSLPNPLKLTESLSSWVDVSQRTLTSSFPLILPNSGQFSSVESISLPYDRRVPLSSDTESTSPLMSERRSTKMGHTRRSLQLVKSLYLGVPVTQRTLVFGPRIVLFVVTSSLLRHRRPRDTETGGSSGTNRTLGNGASRSRIVTPVEVRWLTFFIWGYVRRNRGS